MPTVSRTWSFTSGPEGFSLSGVAVWSGADGAPSAGCIEGAQSGRNSGSNNVGSFDIATTFEGCGVPPGATVKGFTFFYRVRAHLFNVVNYAFGTVTVDGIGDTFEPSAVTAWTQRSIASGSLDYTSGDVIDIAVSMSLRTANNNNAAVGLRYDDFVLVIDYDEPSAEPPVITVVSVSTDKISSVPGANFCTATFASDTALSQWEARANGSGPGSGDLVASGGSVPAGGTFDVHYSALTWGDITYRINVYGQSEQGVWNNYE